MQSLTPRQAEVLDAIRRHIALTGQSPTVREVGKEVHLRSSCSVQKHLDALERLGKIRRSSFKYRSIELVDGHLMNTGGSVLIPLLGQVAGGAPMTAHQAEDPELLPLPEILLPRCDRRVQAEACATRSYESAPFFALTVKGDSMEGAGIADGDLVVARRQRVADNGDIVIAMVGLEEATVKRFFRQGEAIRLEPENPRFEPLISRDVQIVGKVALAIKRF
jgi:repressor LexA